MTSARDKLRESFIEHVGEILGKTELAEVAGISEWARRIRELREDEGLRIESHHDNPSLKPGQYRLVSLERDEVRTRHSVDQATRAKVLLRNGRTCQMCGAEAGEPDPQIPSRKIRLEVHHVDPEGPTVESNLRTLCNRCNEGLANLPVPAVRINLLSAVRRAGSADQKAVYEWLRRKFEQAGEKTASDLDVG